MIKHIASHRPLVSSTKLSERVITLINNLLASPAPLQVLSLTLIFSSVEFLFIELMNTKKYIQDVAVMESQSLALDCVVATVFDGSNELAGGSSEAHYALCGNFQGI